MQATFVPCCSEMQNIRHQAQCLHLPVTLQQNAQLTSMDIPGPRSGQGVAEVSTGHSPPSWLSGRGDRTTLNRATEGSRRGQR